MQVNNLEMRSTRYHFNDMHCIIFYRNLSLRGCCKGTKRWRSSCMQQNVTANKDCVNTESGNQKIHNERQSEFLLLKVRALPSSQKYKTKATHREVLIDKQRSNFKPCFQEPPPGCSLRSKQDVLSARLHHNELLHQDRRCLSHSSQLENHCIWLLSIYCRDKDTT